MSSYPMSAKVTEYEGERVVSLSLPSALAFRDEAILDLKDWQELLQRLGPEWHVNRAGEVQRGGVPTRPNHDALLMADAIMLHKFYQEVSFVGAEPRDYRRRNFLVANTRRDLSPPGRPGWISHGLLGPPHPSINQWRA